MHKWGTREFADWNRGSRPLCRLRPSAKIWTITSPLLFLTKAGEARTGSDRRPSSLRHGYELSLEEMSIRQYCYQRLHENNNPFYIAKCKHCGW